MTLPDIARLAVPRAVIAHCRLPAWEAEAYVSHSACSSVGLSFTRQSCVVDVAGRIIARPVETASVVVAGPGQTSWLRVEEPSEIIEISGDADLRGEIAEELCIPASDLADLGYGGGPITWAVAARLRVLARRLDTADEIEAEALVRRFYGNVFIAQFGGRLRERSDGALDRRRLDRVADYIDGHLGAVLTLAALADVAALSPFHFQRSFRRATGCTPHQYVAMRRAERVRRQLAQGRLPTEIAQALGYRNQRSLRLALASRIG